MDERGATGAAARVALRLWRPARRLRPSGDRSGVVAGWSRWRASEALPLAIACLAAACARAPAPDPRATPSTPRLDGHLALAPDAGSAAASHAALGGLSGAAFDALSGELLVVSDDRADSRVYRLRVRDEPLRVDVAGVITLRGTPAPLDPEGLALLPDGHLLVSSEGVQNEDPRTPPGLFEYTRDGQFVRALDVRPRYLPPASGPITRGARANASFESLALGGGREQVLTALEAPLVQDGEPPSFDRGARVRLLEYVRSDNAYVPGREWLYDVDPTGRPPFRIGQSVNGLVELAWLGGTAFLALERSYVENADDPARSVNRIRLYRISLDGATDVSSLDTIAGRADLRPVSKELVLDLGSAPGLPPDLAELDNFEALALGRPGPDGRPRLFVISDDNFSASQRTWFLRLAF